MATVAKVDHPAKRGDLVVVRRSVWDFTSVKDQFDVMVVTNVTRAGVVKAVRDVNSDHAQPIDRICGFRKCHIIPAASVDMAAAVEAVRGHHWPDHPRQLQSFDTLDEVRALLAPHIRTEAA